jgi:hypothetical protein
MAVIWMDGFDTYTATTEVAARYAGATSSVTLSTTGSRFGGPCYFPGTTGLTVNFTHSGSAASIVGATVLPPGTTNALFSFYNTTFSTSTPELTLVNDTGTVKLYRGSNIGTLLATAAATYTTGVWRHYEIKVTIADAGGTVEVRIDGTVALTFTGDTRQSTTGTAGVDRITFGGASNSNGAWDDIYILDASGSVANDFIGDVRVNTLAPTSDAAVQFTRSTGASNYLCVDEGKMNSDTDYVESATVGHIDRYGYADLAASVATVYAVQPTTWCRKTDATARTMRNKLVSGATTSNGSSFTLTTTYQAMATPLTLDPNTSAQWTVSNANAATAGFEVLT